MIEKKRSYQRPRLTTYGRLETVTHTNVSMNMADMSGAGFKT